MNKELYRGALIDLFENPTNRGEMSSPDMEGYLVNNLCGDEVRIQCKMQNSARLDSSKSRQEFRVIDKVLFSGDGCLLSQVSASLLAKNLEGKNLEKVKKLDTDDILNLIGITPTPARMKCALLSLDVLKEALKQVQS